MTLFAVSAASMLTVGVGFKLVADGASSGRSFWAGILAGSGSEPKTADGSIYRTPRRLAGSAFDGERANRRSTVVTKRSASLRRLFAWDRDQWV